MTLRGLAVVGTAVTALVLAGCGNSGGTSTTASGVGGSSAASTAKIRIVASTNVYGDIAQRIAGGAAEVTSLINDPSQDPHSFEASPQALVALSKANIIIENGGGYDDFIETLRKTAGGDPTVLNAVDISGFAAQQGDDLNEHVWYDFPTMAKVVDELAAALSHGRPLRVVRFHRERHRVQG